MGIAEMSTHTLSPRRWDLCIVKDDCTDLELRGGEQIPSRLNEVHSVDLPMLAVAEFNFHDLIVRQGRS